MRNTPEAVNEYRSYISRLFDLSDRGTSTYELAEYLRRVAIDGIDLIDAAGNAWCPTNRRALQWNR